MPRMRHLSKMLSWYSERALIVAVNIEGDRAFLKRNIPEYFGQPTLKRSTKAISSWGITEICGNPRALVEM